MGCPTPTPSLRLISSGATPGPFTRWQRWDAGALAGWELPAGWWRVRRMRRPAVLDTHSSAVPLADALPCLRANSAALHALPQELFPGTFLATPTHYFMRLLHDKGLLLRCFTQVSRQAQAGKLTRDDMSWLAGGVCKMQTHARLCCLLTTQHLLSLLSPWNHLLVAHCTIAAAYCTFCRTSTAWSTRQGCPQRRWLQPTATLTPHAASRCPGRRCCVDCAHGSVHKRHASF